MVYEKSYCNQPEIATQPKAGGYCSRGVYHWPGYGGCVRRLGRAPSPGLYEFAPQEEGDEAEEAAVAENGQAPELELAEA